MRPIQLVLAGLHSYREKQVIDFETLCEAGLFGIFGPTGSGKSTILDAITLALYGQVVRMGGTSHPLQVLNQLEDRLFVSFTFELGKGEACRKYTIEREFGIDKKGNKRQPEVRLIQRGRVEEEPDFVVESKATLATQAVEKLIGLTIHDFTRAVVLPQGQFSKFLTLKGSERNEMLQRIFHLHEYGEKLNERIRALTETNKAEFHQLELELAKLGEAGPEALLAATTELEAVQQQELALRSQFEGIQERKQAMEQLRMVQTELDKVHERLQALQLDEPRIQELQTRIQQIEASLRIWPLIDRRMKIEREQTRTEQDLQELRGQKQEASSRFEAQELAYQESLRILRSEEPAILQQQVQLTQALEWEQELEVGREAITQLAQEIQEKQTLESQLAEVLGKEEQQLRLWQEEITAIETHLQELIVTPEARKQAQVMLDAKNAWLREMKLHAEQLQESERVTRQITAISQQVQQLKEKWSSSSQSRQQAEVEWQDAQKQPVISDQELEFKRDCLMQVKGIGKEWRELELAQKSWQQKYDEWHMQMTEGAGNKQRAEEQVKTLEHSRQERILLKQEAEQQLRQWQQANMAQALRGTLVQGEACPVCGSCEHDRAVDHHEFTPLQQAEEELQQGIAAAEQVLAEVERKLDVCKQELQAVLLQEAGLRQKEASLTEEKAALSARYTSIVEQLHQLGENWVVERIDQLLANYQAADHELKQQLARKETQKQHMEELQQKLTQLREQELQTKADFDKQAALFAQGEEQLRLIQDRLQGSTARVEQAETQLNQASAGVRVEDIEEHYAALQKREEEHTRKQQLHKQLAEQIKGTRDQFQEKKEKRAELASMLTLMNKQLQEKRETYDEKNRQLSLRTGGAKASALLPALEEKLVTYRQTAEANELARNQLQETRQRLHEGLLKLEESALQLARQYQEASLAVEQSMLTTDLQDQAQVEQMYQQREQLDDFQTQVKAHQTTQAKLHYDHERLTEKLGGLTTDPQAWEELLQAWQEIDAAWTTMKEQVVLASRQVAIITTNHDKWLEVHKRYEEIADEQSRLDDLRKLFEAKAFVQFITEEKMTSIARDASYHLARMTKNRYALEIGAEGEFILRDEAAGGHKRSVSTLSGGETFLTSLALALALSVEIQMRGSRLEFFFLDEGFGTLDPELLELVLDALERLRMDDFAIGLISHVPEIKERMPRRLVITAAEPMGRGSQIELEVE